VGKIISTSVEKPEDIEIIIFTCALKTQSEDADWINVVRILCRMSIWVL
jgi:hypothetical protein